MVLVYVGVGGVCGGRGGADGNGVQTQLIEHMGAGSQRSLGGRVRMGSGRGGEGRARGAGDAGAAPIHHPSTPWPLISGGGRLGGQLSLWVWSGRVEDWD